MLFSFKILNSWTSITSSSTKLVNTFCSNLILLISIILGQPPLKPLVIVFFFILYHRWQVVHMDLVDYRKSIVGFFIYISLIGCYLSHDNFHCFKYSILRAILYNKPIKLFIAVNKYMAFMRRLDLSLIKSFICKIIIVLLITNYNHPFLLQQLT